jgi:hypothetical protein
MELISSLTTYPEAQLTNSEEDEIEGLFKQPF